MQSALYPLKFLPLYKNVIWGGNRLRNYGFNYAPLPNCGELWALSSIRGHESVVANGFLSGNTINEIIEIYMGDLVGDNVYNRYGNEFPLLFKVIDAAQDLSIQVHPTDELARKRGMPYGKTEMWYVIQADSEASIISGFICDTAPEQYLAAIDNGNIETLLHVDYPKVGDVCFIPAGRVHALGKGMMVAEIQQASDCTYRIYDYNRVDADGRKRELHTAQALDAIDFHAVDGHTITKYQSKQNSTVTVASCPYFTTRIISFNTPIRKNIEDVENFIVYFCVNGLSAVKCSDVIVPIHVGECVLVPAVTDNVELFAEGEARLLEVTIDTEGWNDPQPSDNDLIAYFIGG